MSFMDWSKDYEIGIPRMDSQHKKWLELLNKFYDHLNTGEFNKKLLDLLNDALEYTNFHFKEEEALMTSIGYAALSEQKSMHNDISRKISEFKTKLESNQHILSLSITNELKSWFTQHIMIEDKKYASIYLSKSS